MVKEKMSRRDLHEYLYADAKRAEEVGLHYSIADCLLLDEKYLLRKYVVLLRKDEYYTANPHWFTVGLRIWYRKRKNKLGMKLGIQIPHFVCKPGLTIWHGGVIVNEKAVIGENCQFHGQNCIGNRGTGRGDEAPIIGDQVEIGVGAKIIGNVFIANNNTIGAGAIVVNSHREPGGVLGGIPARKIK